MRNLVSRVLTAVALLPPLLLLVLRGPSWALFLVTLLAGGHALREWWEMTGFPRGLFLLAVTGYFAAFFLATRSLIGALWVLLAIPTLYFLLRFEKENFLVPFSLALAGLIYTFVGFWSLYRLSEAGRLSLLFLLTLIFAEDTAAYFGGRSFGRHPFFAAVSPKKTLEGYLCGVFAGTAAAFVLAVKTGLFPPGEALLLGLSLSVLAPAGDLLESMVKRACGVKDSGRILPGHGGLLDRVDALIFLAPLFRAYLEIRGGGP